MSDFWKGAFLPVTKHVTSVDFKPIQEMTNEDWDILDWEALRPSAKDSLSTMIVSGTMVGFYVVNVDLHKAHRPHGGKPRYYYPAATNKVSQEFVSELQAQTNFDADIDQEAIESKPSQRMDDLMFWLSALVTVETARIIMEKLAEEKSVPYEEFDNSFELLEMRHRMLILAIGLFAVDPPRARAILKSVDILDEEVYAALNDEEPLE